MSVSAPSLQATIGTLFDKLPRTHQKALVRVPDSAHATADTAACLLGQNLWYPPLAQFRDRLIETGERPHLWTFGFGPTCAWDARRWNDLALPARMLRARAGSVAQRVAIYVSSWSLQMDKRRFNAGLEQLLHSHLCDRGAHGFHSFEPIATVQELYVDLALIEIIAHWLWMLRHRERVLADPHATGFEVHGYRETCSLCRDRWGLRPRERHWVPPFHPGCRCFAQPRFAWS